MHIAQVGNDVEARGAHGRLRQQRGHCHIGHGMFVAHMGQPFGQFGHLGRQPHHPQRHLRRPFERIFHRLGKSGLVVFVALLQDEHDMPINNLVFVHTVEQALAQVAGFVQDGLHLLMHRLVGATADSETRPHLRQRGGECARQCGHRSPAGGRP